MKRIKQRKWVRVELGTLQDPAERAMRVDAGGEVYSMLTMLLALLALL